MAQDKETQKPTAPTKTRSRRLSPPKPSRPRPPRSSRLRPLLDTDEPPIIISGGSLSLELPRNHNSGSPKQIVPVSTPGQFPITYEITEERNRALERVFIVIQPGALGPVTTFDTGTLLEAKNCILKIWLQLLQAGGGEFDYEPIGSAAPADIIIQGPSPQTGARTRIEINSRGAFGPRVQTHKKIWPGRHDLYGLPRHFRIGKVRILEGDNTTVVMEHSGGNGYQLYFTFHHH